MATFLKGMIAFLISFSALAGTITNESTGETIKLTLNSNTKEIQVTSTTPYLEDGIIKLSKVKDTRERQRVSNMTKEVNDKYYYDVDDSIGGFLTTVLVPIYNIPRLFGWVVDLVSLPITAPRTIYKNTQMKTDFKILKQAILSKEGKVDVGDARFERIAKLLSKKVSSKKK